MSSVVFYISGHGFGHSIRQIAIINALLRRARRDLRIIVRTSAPEWLFERTVDGPFTLVSGETDTGVVQFDALRLDERQTVRRAIDFQQALPERAAKEAALLVEERARLVVSDVPPLACAAAEAAGIPSVVCSNFTWDWIYAAYAPVDARVPKLTADIARAYSSAAAGWRMPMHGGFAGFRDIVDLPLVARHAHRTRDQVRAALGLPQDRPLALISFGGYGVRDLPLDRLDCLGSWGVVMIAARAALRPVDDHVYGIAEEDVYEGGVRYEDLVAAMDAVVTKPGYGIISDCIANGVAVLYTSRGAFPEYDVLVREMPRYLRCEFIELDAFLAGTWKAALERLARKPTPPETIRTDGAETAARMIEDAAAGPTSPR